MLCQVRPSNNFFFLRSRGGGKRRKKVVVYDLTRKNQTFVSRVIRAKSISILVAVNNASAWKTLGVRLGEILLASRKLIVTEKK